MLEANQFRSEMRKNKWDSEEFKSMSKAMHDRFYGFYEYQTYHNPYTDREEKVKVKVLGGMWAIYCEEDQQIIFRKSEYLRDRSYNKFSDGLCEDSISCGNLNNEELIPIAVYENNNCMRINKVKRYYSLPGKIDITKLTEEEFETLRNLIKKGLVIN